MGSKYLEVMAYVKDLLKSGKFTSGSKAPSIRDICRLTKCSKSTALRAYVELQKEHILYSVPKSGYYVVEKNAEDKQKHDLMQNNFCFCSYNSPFEEGLYSTSIIDFSSTLPDIETFEFPYEELQLCINHAAKKYTKHLLSYPSTQGSFELRKALQKDLRNHQIFAKVDNIFATSGTQQTLYILSKMPFPNCKQNVLVEQPTYFGMIKALELNHVTAIGIERKPDGIDMDELERIFRSGNIKFFYLIPRFHNPTGLSYTNEQKKQILSLADKYDVYIVEDDYLADLEVNTKWDPMFSQDLSNRVIYLKSFSKTLIPGIRVSTAVIPPLLVNMFKEYKACCDTGPTILSKGIIEVFIKSGMYDVHVKRLKDLYRRKMKRLGECISVLPSGVKIIVPDTGIFACIHLPGNMKASSLVNRLQSKGVLVATTEDAFLPEYRKNRIIRLSTCKVDEEKIMKGIQIISDAIKNGVYNCDDTRHLDYYDQIL